MGFVFVDGAEAQSNVVSRITTISGSPIVYATGTDAAPGGSEAAFAFPAGFGGVHTMPLLVTGRDDFVISMRLRVTAVENIGFLFALRSSTTQYAGVYTNSGGTLTAFRNFSALATGALAHPVSDWFRLRIEIKRSVSGYIRAYINGALAVDFTGDTLFDWSGSIQEVFVERGFFASSLNRFDDLVIIDPTDSTHPTTLPSAVSVVPVAVVANGLRQEQASGTFADVDEIPPSMTDFVGFSAPDQRFTVRTAAAPVGAAHLGLLVQTLQQRSGSSAGDNIRAMFTTSGADTYGATQNAPANGPVVDVFPLDGSGTPWTKATLDAVLTADGVGVQTRT